MPQANLYGFADNHVLAPKASAESPQGRPLRARHFHPWSNQSFANSVCTCRTTPREHAETVPPHTPAIFLRSLLRMRGKGFCGSSIRAHKTRSAKIVFLRRLLDEARRAGEGNCTLDKCTGFLPLRAPPSLR